MLSITCVSLQSFVQAPHLEAAWPGHFFEVLLGPLESLERMSVYQSSTSHEPRLVLAWVEMDKDAKFVLKHYFTQSEHILLDMRQ